MRVAFLESFYGGSHRQFADGLQANSRHTIDLVTLPDRLWKWRYRTAALELLRQLDPGVRYDLVVCSGLLRVADVKALWPGTAPPLLLYLHETQLSYPRVDAGAPPAPEFVTAEITNLLAADQIAFNSRFHRRAALAGLQAALGRLPDAWSAPQRAGVLKKVSGARVCYPAWQPPRLPSRRRPVSGPPTILWNHRWEFDKAPQEFLEALARLSGRGLDFRLALLGERLISGPRALQELRRRYAARITADGYLSRDEYFQVLATSDLVVSTARQENFGYSVMEALWAGCQPLLPTRLVYPELIPGALHRDCLYTDLEDLVNRLAEWLQQPAPVPEELRHLAESHTWTRRAGQIDAVLEETAGWQA